MVQPADALTTFADHRRLSLLISSNSSSTRRSWTKPRGWHLPLATAAISGHCHSVKGERTNWRPRRCPQVTALLEPRILNVLRDHEPSFRTPIIPHSFAMASSTIHTPSLRTGFPSLISQALLLFSNTLKQYGQHSTRWCPQGLSCLAQISFPLLEY